MTFGKLCRALLAPAICGALLGPAAAGDWPGFRGAGDGIAQKEKSPIWFNASSNLLWRVEVRPGLSSPVIREDKIFLTAEDGKKLITVCHDARTGKLIWEKPLEVENLEPVHKANSHATSTPVTDGKA